MKIGDIARIEIEIGERSYCFLCERDSPLGEVHDALAMMKSAIVQKIQEADKPSESQEKTDG